MRILKIGVVTWLALAGPAFAEPWGPWGAPQAPEPSAHTGETPDNSASLPFQLLLRAYQLTLSGQDIAACPMLPTCSRFAMQAYADYGPMQGTLMTADRLLRDNPDAHERYPHVRVGDRTRLYDPPAEHVLW
jgi:putative component of membrane protein insertase Oxa1/YidC/SpoIIIJ protein YidD